MNSEGEFIRVFGSHDERAKGLMSLLPDTTDITLITLKGHLIIEEALYSIVRDHCNHPRYITEAKLSFFQLSNVAKALINLPMHEFIFPAISKLNKLRNELAHNISSDKTQLLAKEFVSLCKQEVSPETELSEQVKFSICYILGGLSVLGAASVVLKNAPKSAP